MVNRKSINNTRKKGWCVLMKIKPIDNPKEHRSETVMADILLHKEDNVFEDLLCIVLCADKKHRMLAMRDALRLDSYQLRWIANRLDEFNSGRKVSA